MQYQIEEEIFEVYIWERSDDIGFKNAQEEECYHIWYSENGDCKDTGKECDVIVEEGEYRIVCCDECIL